MTRRVGTLVWVAAAIASPVAGQVPTPVPTPTPAAPLPVPAAPVIVLPAATPSPVATVSAPIPHTTATPTPRPSATPTSRASASPSPSPTPSPSIAAPVAAAPISPVPEATVVSTPVPAPILAPPPADATRYWPTALITGLAVSLALSWGLLRRRSIREVGSSDAYVQEPVAAPVPSTDPRARLAMTLRPMRAGLNLLTATSENEIVVTNVGDGPAANIRMAVTLISAHADHDAELAALYDAPIGRSAVPPFTLEAGEQRVVTTVAALLRDAIKPLTAAGRPMFVPIVAVNMTYAAAGSDARLAQAFAVGVERVDSSKLAPFWLDVPPRSYDQVAARVHGAALER